MSQQKSLLTSPFWQTRVPLWKHAVTQIILVSFFYILMEWIFFVTKSSFMDALPFSEKVRLLLVTGFAVTMIALLTLPVIFLLETALSPILPGIREYAYQVPAAFLASCVALILIDNFTYTVLKFGIVNAPTLGRVIYALLYLGILAYFIRKMAAEATASVRGKTITSGVLFCGMLLLTGFSYTPGSANTTIINPDTTPTNKPNVILLNTDGLNASSMSVYGYERDTTPFLREMAQTSLVSANHFTNAGHTMGSETAALTGKLPMTTHVLYPPDTLKGVDKFEHLPGILKQLGYQSVELGVAYFVDANIIDFQNAFDEINCAENTTHGNSNHWMGSGYDNSIYFLTTVSERISERLGHIFFIKEMVNPMEAVSQTSTTSESDDDTTDEQRMDCLKSYLAESEQTGKPLFAHVHLMGTHGAQFDPSVRVFSKGETQTKNWMTDFYDDSIRSFDAQVQDLVQYLKDHGQYDNTILVIYSDHGQHWTSLKKIPLIIHFPEDQHSGVIYENTQNIDIAPTVLDAMGIKKPDWMEGDSLLEPIDPNRLIVSTRSDIMGPDAAGKWEIIGALVKPPFYQFTEMTVIQCQRYYLGDLTEMSWGQGEIDGYTRPCTSDSLDPFSAIKRKTGKLLTGIGYVLPLNW